MLPKVKNNDINKSTSNVCSDVHTKISADSVHISDVDGFSKIIGGITVHNYTAAGVPMSKELTLMPLF